MDKIIPSFQINRFKEIRKYFELTQQDVSKQTGLTQKTISYLERGKMKTIPLEYILFLLSNNICLNWFFGRSNIMFWNKKEQSDSIHNNISNTISHKNEINTTIVKKTKEYVDDMVYETQKKQIEKLEIEKQTLINIITKALNK